MINCGKSINSQSLFSKIIFEEYFTTFSNKFCFFLKRFDEENLGVIHSDAFLKKLGLTEFISNGPRSDVGGRKQPNEVHVSNENSHSALDVPLPNVSSTLIYLT